MFTSINPRRNAVASPFIGFVVISILGCGPSGPRTFNVHGRIDLVGADVSHLEGSHVEAVLVSDNTVRASGVIQSDGSFTLQTQHGGEIRAGAREGRYLVRIILNDDDRDTRRRAARAIAPRFLAFQTSGLTLDVPANGEATLSVSQK